MFSMGYRRAKSTQGNTNFQKRIFLATNFGITTRGPKGSSERSQKLVVCAALCASWFKNMATGIDRTGRRAQATRAQTTTDVQIGLLRPTDFATVQYFIQLPPIMLGFSESADIGLSFWRKNGNIFGQILRNSRKCAKTWINENDSWSQKRLGFLPSCLWKVFLKFFLLVNPIPIRNNSDKASVHRAFSRLKRKTRMFFWRFFRLSANFRPYSSAIFHPNTPHNFMLPVISIW